MAREMRGELEPLRLSAGERWDRLPEAHVFETDVRQGLQAVAYFPVSGKEKQRFRDGQVEHVGDTLGRR